MNTLQVFDRWSVWVMGWPAVALSLVCATAGLALRRTSLYVAGAILAVPFCAYLALNPGMRLIGSAVSILFFVGAYAISRGRRTASLLLLLPFVMVAAWLAMQVTRQ